MLYSDKNEQKWNACWELSLIETRLLNCSKIPADVRGTQSFQFHDKWRYGFWVIAYLVTEAMWKYLFTCADNNNNKALYLYPIHAGLHLQLLHSFPGLGDAGRAVVGDAVLHGAPVTPNRCKGGGDSVNVTLNQHPPGDSSTLMEQLLYYNLTPTRSFLHSETWKDPFCLSICYLKKLLCGHQLDSGLSFFSQRSCMIAFLPLSRYYLDQLAGGEVSKEWRAGRD